MTDDKEYEEREREIERVFGERKAINKRFLVACEQKLDSFGLKNTSDNPTKWIIGKLAFQ